MATLTTTAAKPFIGIRTKLLVGFTVLFTLTFAGVYYWFYQFATTSAMNRIRDDMVATLEAAAAGADGAELIALHREGVTRADGLTDDPRYWRQLEWLDTVHKIEPRAWLYTYVPGDTSKNEVTFITDVNILYDATRAASFNEATTLEAPEANYGGMTQTTLYLTPYEDNWGHWVSAYTPVRDAQGNVVAGMGIDFEAEYVFQVQNAIKNSVVVAFAITYLALLALIVFFARTFSRPLLRLTTIATRIGEGDYNQDFSKLTRAAYRDEIDILAEVFQFMVNKVAHREQTLRRHVEELQIEIDVVKRQKQVSEIVDSDFFQDLQLKARQMRQRGSRSRSDAGEGGEREESVSPTPSSGSLSAETAPSGAD